MLRYKIWFDLWHNKGRTLLAVLSIAAGVFAIGAIFGMVDQLLSGMDAAHRAVAPSHVNIILRGLVDGDTARQLLDVPGVAGVDPVNQISVRYKTRPGDDWALGTLVMRDDYEQQTYDLFDLKDGTWPAGGSIGIERLTGQFYNVAIGDTVIFDVNGREQTFPVSGQIRHPFVPPPTFGGQAHFFTDPAGLAEFGIPAGRYAQLLVQVDNYSLEHAQDVAGDIRARLGELGVGVAVTLYQEPDRHWGRMFVEGITIVLQLMAVVSLFLSVFLVFNTFTALIAQQTDQIGTIKAIGGRRRHILGVYLAEVLIYGSLALLIALPLSALTAFYSTQWFLNLFNIDYLSFQVAPRALILQLLAALILPLLAALWPIWKGASISVREAMATYGLGSDFGSSRLDRLVDQAGERLLPTPYAIALGNMFRRKGRLLLTLLVLVTAGVMFLVVMSLISSTMLTLDNDMGRRAYDVRIGFERDQPVSDIAAVLEATEGLAAHEIWYSRNATLLRAGERLEDSAGLGAQLTGIPAGSIMQQPLITAGRWLTPDDDRAVVISQKTAEQNGIAVGDTLTLDLGQLGTADWQVVGTYRVVYNGGFVTEPVYAPLAVVADATGRDGLGTQLYLQTVDQTPAGAAAVADDLKARFEAAGMRVDLYTTALKSDERANVDNQFYAVVSTLLGLAMLMASVGGLGQMGALGISVVERTREIGVMRAIGARSPVILSLFVMEGLLQGLISWLLAIPVAYLLAQPLAQLMGQTMIEIDLDYAFNLPAVWIWLATVVIISLLASLLPGRDATRISVRQSLAYA